MLSLLTLFIKINSARAYYRSVIIEIKERPCELANNKNECCLLDYDEEDSFVHAQQYKKKRLVGAFSND
ncbi:hypothetical protein RCH20_001007 [Psychrobacter sp. PL15]|nr:hypothetical protein [Psychrobacter sp. PL15]